MRIYREEFRAKALKAISDSAECHTASGCTEDSIDCLMDLTHELFYPVNKLIIDADHCETFTSLPPWRYDLEDLMVDRWESFCNSVHFFLQVDCYEKVDKEIDLLFEWIKETSSKYIQLMEVHIEGV